MNGLLKPAYILFNVVGVTVFQVGMALFLLALMPKVLWNEWRESRRLPYMYSAQCHYGDGHKFGEPTIHGNIRTRACEACHQREFTALAGSLDIEEVERLQRKLDHAKYPVT